MHFPLATHYAQLAEKGVSLRICPRQPKKPYRVSLFGPGSVSLHGDVPARRTWLEFHNWTYAPKSRGIQPQVPPLPAASLTQVDPVMAWIKTQEITSTNHTGAAAAMMNGDRLSPNDAVLPAQASRRPPGLHHMAGTLSVPVQQHPLQATDSRLIDDSDQCSKLIDDSDHCSRIAFNMPPLIPGLPSPGKQGDILSEKEPPNGDDDQKLSRIDTPESILPTSSFVPGNRLRRQDPTRVFLDEFIEAISQLTERGRASPGRLALRMNFGRICTWGWDERALAVNKDGEPSNGYRTKHLVDVLDKKLSTPGRGVLFTKILAIHGNDADYLSTLTEPGTALRMWQRLSRSIIYAFICEDRRDTTKVNAAQRFVVEVVTSQRGNFECSIRKVDNELGKFFIHGLWRNWDLQAVLASETGQEFEMRYRSFAETLLASIVVPSVSICMFSIPRLPFYASKVAS